MIAPILVSSGLDLEQARDLRRTVLCGELNWERQAVDDGWDQDADVALVVDAAKPVATARLIRRGPQWCVDLVAVLPARRRQGLGTGLVLFLADCAQKKGGDRLWVLAPPRDAPFFQAVGFSCIRGEGDVWLFSRELV